MQLAQHHGGSVRRAASRWSFADRAGVDHIYGSVPVGLLQLGKRQAKPDQDRLPDFGLRFVVNGLDLHDVRDAEPREFSNTLSTLEESPVLGAVRLIRFPSVSTDIEVRVPYHLPSHA